MSTPGDLTTDQTTQATAESYTRADFVSIEFPKGTMGFTTLGREVTIGGVTYKPSPIVSVAGLKSSASRKPKRITVSLPGTDETLRDRIDDDNAHFAQVRVDMAFLDGDSNVIGGLVLRGKGLLSSARLDVSMGEAAVEIVADSPTVKFLRDRRVIGQDADQQWRYPGDKFLSLRPLIEDSEAQWGGQNQRAGSGGGGFARRGLTPGRGPILEQF